MDKLIISNRSGLPMDDALRAALAVVKMGRVSNTAKGDQYCFITGVDVGDTRLRVYADRNKESDRLTIVAERKINEEARL